MNYLIAKCKVLLIVQVLLSSFQSISHAHEMKYEIRSFVPKSENFSTTAFIKNTIAAIDQNEPYIKGTQRKKLELFRKLIIKNKKTISQILIFYVVNQFLLTYILKNNDKSVYPFLKKSYPDISTFLTTNEEFMELSEKYFQNNDLNKSYKYIPLILKLHEKDKINNANNGNKKSKPQTLWKITPEFLVEITYGAGKNKENIMDLTSPKATIFMSKYFKDRYEELQKNTYYVIVEYLTRDEGKNILKPLLKEAAASSVEDIEEYLNVEDRIKIREFLAVYFYDNIMKNSNFDFYKDPLIVDVLKKNSLF